MSWLTGGCPLKPHQTTVMLKPHQTTVMLKPHQITLMLKPHQTTVMLKPHQTTVMLMSLSFYFTYDISMFGLLNATPVYNVFIVCFLTHLCPAACL
jgi:hypothetical protein